VDFELSGEQELLRNGLRELFERACDIRRVRATAYEGEGYDRELWQALHDAGWTGATVPEEHGGQGLRFEEAILIAEEAGRAVAPVPLTTTLLAARLAARAPEGATRSELLSRIASGASVTLALTGAGGKHTFVPYGPHADLVLAANDSPGIELLDTPGLGWTDLQAMDRTVPQYELPTMNTSGTSLFGGTGARPAIDALVGEWRVLLAAETLGACEKILELSVAYAKERVQFGRPIGANQAVKARIADMAFYVDRMRAAVYNAAVKFDADAEDRSLAAAMAKAAAGEPGAFVGSQGIHVHGGIGFTWEHDLHIYFKRVKSNELLLGDTSESLSRVADAVL
jgi:alkylation response protein AidB-like acyl-CoA dehydrogenase